MPTPSLVRLTLLAALGLFALGCSGYAEPGPGRGTDKVVLCHKGKTLQVAAPAARAHYDHGDTPGPCR